MLQDQDALRKVGRGGAGNYYPSKQVDETSKDIEAQELNTTAALPTNSSSHDPARAGRGGAGNFVDSAAQHRREQEQLADETAAAVTSSLKKHPHRAGLSGRGGSGNFNGDGPAAAEHARRQEEEGRSKVTELDRKVMEAVERGLKIPEKVHHSLSKHEP